MADKPRLDELLVQRGYFPDVHAAQAAVLAGDVVVGQHRETSAGRRVSADAPIRVKAGKAARTGGFVGRGGLKLEHALGAFGIDARGLSCADLGCSTGGFTDCLLKHGAQHVSAVDVGHADFAWSLRNDARVSLFERTNVRGIDVAAIGGPFQLVVADLSFIRLESVLADVARLLAPEGSLVALVKPQFELPRAQVGAGGVVHSAASHVEVLCTLARELAERGLRAQAFCYSPIVGAKGNIEFFVHARHAAAGDCQVVCPHEVERVVAAAHGALGGQACTSS